MHRTSREKNYLNPVGVAVDEFVCDVCSLVYPKPANYRIPAEIIELTAEKSLYPVQVCRDIPSCVTGGLALLPT